MIGNILRLKIKIKQTILYMDHTANLVGDSVAGKHAIDGYSERKEDDAVKPWDQRPLKTQGVHSNTELMGA